MEAGEWLEAALSTPRQGMWCGAQQQCWHPPTRSTQCGGSCSAVGGLGWGSRGAPLDKSWGGCRAVDELPTFLVWLQAGHWKAQGWECQHAECCCVSARGAPVGRSSTPTPGSLHPTPGVASGSWHTFGARRIPTQSRHRARVLCSHSRVGAWGCVAVPAGLPPHPHPVGPHMCALSPAEAAGWDVWGCRMGAEDAAPQSGAEEFIPPRSTMRTHCHHPLWGALGRLGWLGPSGLVLGCPTLAWADPTRTECWATGGQIPPDL